jgi:predicted enzyme related to lactoylglutathione lyase
MSEQQLPEIGAIAWTDLTLPDAAGLRDFYGEVVGWHFAPVNMGDYDDYSMNTPENDRTVAGICHARGGNAKMPPQWLVYITVADVNASAIRCVELGGEVIVEPKDLGPHGQFCVIQDPAGAVAALFTPAG